MPAAQLTRCPRLCLGLSLPSVRAPRHAGVPRCVARRRALTEGPPVHLARRPALLFRLSARRARVGRAHRRAAVEARLLAEGEVVGAIGEASGGAVVRDDPQRARDGRGRCLRRIARGHHGHLRLRERLVAVTVACGERGREHECSPQGAHVNARSARGRGWWCPAWDCPRGRGQAGSAGASRSVAPGCRSRCRGLGAHAPRWGFRLRSRPPGS